MVLHRLTDLATGSLVAGSAPLQLSGKPNVSFDVYQMSCQYSFLKLVVGRKVSQ